MHVVLVASHAPSLFRFRGHLIRSVVGLGHRVTALAPPTVPGVIRSVLELGAAYRPIPLDPSGRNPLRDLGTLLCLRRCFLDLKPDRILLYTMKPVIYGSLAARSICHQHCYSMITGLGYALGEKDRRRGLQLLMRGLFHFALPANSAIIVQNPDDLSFFAGRAFAPHSRLVLVNGSGVDLAHFSPAPPVVNGPVFSFMGRLLRAKGIREFIEAAVRVKRLHPQVVFRILGRFDDNPDALDLTVLAGALRAGTVEYHGYRPDVRPFLASTSVFVLPSYREGTPRSVLEAMAMARPVITTDVPGCRETVVTEFNGHLVPPRDARALASAMLRFVEEPQWIPSMGENSRRLAEQKYDVHLVNRAIIEALAL